MAGISRGGMYASGVFTHGLQEVRTKKHLSGEDWLDAAAGVYYEVDRKALSETWMLACRPRGKDSRA